MSYSHEPSILRGYPHSDCGFCGEEIYPTRKCLCLERGLDGLWVEKITIKNETLD